MKHTHKAHVITKPEYGFTPSENSMPIMAKESDLPTYEQNGWIVTGTATISVEYLSEEEVSAKQLDALKTELKTVRANNQQRENAIVDRINKLQALTYVEA